MASMKTSQTLGDTGGFGPDNLDGGFFTGRTPDPSLRKPLLAADSIASISSSQAMPSSPYRLPPVPAAPTKADKGPFVMT
jgi:hypothetical protein